ncbi:NAD(P)/FAD-dependent oxidoreductase [Mucilaginibacter sp. X5P1]|uniref:NAD(P)/FAD-dependent oxidoreductase n=1 Tax=Mucilaginibacter sp. X5P1 TaxID=2723088 RepID=UPI0016169666|nr:NAD(P)/FAD-dependent oxidoreductase [Mucilaginibacter sp. X5P1]MBB6138349.1 NADH dehydrogenase [Mucilaginibacter sp. X5P1]
MQKETTTIPRVLIIGGGFGGIQLAKNLKKAPVKVMMLDKHNYHTFQPLLYQVAMGAIPADSIGFPLRRIFTRQDNFRFFLADVQKINPESKTVSTDIGDIHYDYLVIATGSDTNFFGNKEIEHYSMPMKNIPEALNLRSLILQNLEKALVTKTYDEREALMTFVVVGGGPTGVELTGALAEMRQLILMKDYHGLKKQHMRVYLVEGKDRLLGAMSEQASAYAKKALTKGEVTIYNSVHVQSYDGYELKIDDGTVIKTRNVFWAAGVRGEVPAGVPKEIITKGTRIQTNEISKVEGYEDIFAIGDVAAMITADYPNGLPGVAPVAMQQGEQLAKNIIRILKKEPTVPFKYLDKGTLATIGRNKAVADLGPFHFKGFIAWLLWGFVHILTLAGFSNKTNVFLTWFLNYFNKNSDNRLVVRYFDTETMMTEPVAK